MTVDLLADEKVLYTKDYARGRSRSVGTVVITDRRVISTVESKKSTERTEIKLEEVGGVTTKFRPASIAMLITGVFLIVFYEVFPYVFFLLPNIPYAIYITYRVFIYAVLALGIIYIIVGLFKLRNSLSVVIYTKNKQIPVISASAISGRVKALMLRPDKAVAKELADNISATIKNATNA